VVKERGGNLSATEQNPGCLGALFRLFGPNAQPEEASDNETLPYHVRDDFLSAAETAFYNVLSSVVGTRVVICPKVRLADIFFVGRPHENRAVLNRIAQKHVDFLLCEPGTLTPLLGLELDDASHKRDDRKARDIFIERVFDTAELPLLRYPAQRSYNARELAALIETSLEGKTYRVADDSVPIVEDAPLCPTCGIPMVKRRATRGERRGQSFFGCANYPKCRETISFE